MISPYQGPEVPERELLIYNVEKEAWNSFIIGGTTTKLRRVNQCFAGVIRETEGASEGTRSVPPGHWRTEDVVLVDPATASIFEVHIGKNPEVLWISDEVIYYKTHASLYKARIENNDVVDRQLLITNPKVFMIHWGFSGN